MGMFDHFHVAPQRVPPETPNLRTFADFGELANVGKDLTEEQLSGKEGDRVIMFRNGKLTYSDSETNIANRSIFRTKADREANEETRRELLKYLVQKLNLQEEAYQKVEYWQNREPYSESNFTYACAEAIRENFGKGNKKLEAFKLNDFECLEGKPLTLRRVTEIISAFNIETAPENRDIPKQSELLIIPEKDEEEHVADHDLIDSSDIINTNAFRPKNMPEINLEIDLPDHPADHSIATAAEEMKRRANTLLNALTDAKIPKVCKYNIETAIRHANKLFDHLQNRDFNKFEKQFKTFIDATDRAYWDKHIATDGRKPFDMTKITNLFKPLHNNLKSIKDQEIRVDGQKTTFGEFYIGLLGGELPSKMAHDLLDATDGKIRIEIQLKSKMKKQSVESRENENEPINEPINIEIHKDIEVEPAEKTHQGTNDKMKRTGVEERNSIQEMGSNENIIVSDDATVQRQKKIIEDVAQEMINEANNLLKRIVSKTDEISAAILSAKELFTYLKKHDYSNFKIHYAKYLKVLTLHMNGRIGLKLSEPENNTKNNSAKVDNKWYQLEPLHKKLPEIKTLPIEVGVKKTTFGEFYIEVLREAKGEGELGWYILNLASTSQKEKPKKTDDNTATEILIEEDQKE